MTFDPNNHLTLFCAVVTESGWKVMSSKERRRKGVLASASGEKSNSLDWDSPSTKTGTVKRRPNSGDSFSDYETHIVKTNDKKLEDKPKRSKDTSQKWFFSPKKFKNPKPIEEKVYHNYEQLDFEAQRKASHHNYELLRFEKPKFPESSHPMVYHNYEELEFEKCDIPRSKIPSRVKHPKVPKHHNYELLSFEKDDITETSNHNYELLDFEDVEVLDDNASYLKGTNCNNGIDQTDGNVMEKQKSRRTRPEQIEGGKERASCRSTINWEQPGSFRGSSDDVGQGVKPSGHGNSNSRRVRVLSLDASQERIKFIHDFVQSKYIVYKKERSKQDGGSKGEGRKSVPTALEWRSFNFSETASGVGCPAKEEGRYGKPTKCRKRLTLTGDFTTGASEKDRQEWTIDNPQHRIGGTDNGIEEEGRLVLEYVAAKPGRVSDTDSGIASPLSPGSVYGFFGCDKNFLEK
ncbi:unnamed protein product, partial [Callosobruchus maculatus]